MTQSEFADWIATVHDDRHYELLDSRVVMEPPVGWPHGSVEATLVAALVQHSGGLGRVFGSSQGFELPSGDTVEPDASFVSDARWGAAPPPVEGEFLRVVPDLIVEILSPGNAFRARGEKKAIYEHNGVTEYRIVDPTAQRVTVFSLQGNRYGGGTIFEHDHEARAGVLPWTIAVADLID
jgi:Uma2 family endonuclease